MRSLKIRLAYIVLMCMWVYIQRMADIDFIRLSALVFATKLIGKSNNPIGEAVGMAEELFNKLTEKEV